MSKHEITQSEDDGKPAAQPLSSDEARGIHLRELLEWAALLVETRHLTESEWNDIDAQVRRELARWVRQ